MIRTTEGGSPMSGNNENGMTRRTWLAATAAAFGGTLLAARSPASEARSANRRTLHIPGEEELVPANMPRGFSREELERRWNKCRHWMQRYDFDALIVPTRPQGNADIKWLTEGSPDWVVFPQTGTPTAIFRASDDAERFERSMPLDMNVVDSRMNRSALIIDSLESAEVGSGRIGVGNLSGTMRNDEGGVSHTTMVRLEKAFPHARFESAAELLMRVKLSRGPEEIEALRLASRASELGIKALVETAGVGVPQREVWFAVFKALLDATGEEPGRVSMRAGAEGNTAEGEPLNEILRGGLILSEEISSSVLGYNSQVNQAVCLGSPAPKHWASTFAFNLDLFEALVDWAKPGRSFADYCAYYKQRVDERIEAVGGEPYFGVVFHTGGALGDGPRMGWGREDESSDLVIEPGMVFTIKPRVPIPGVPSPNCQIGDAVLITESGAERLGRRKLEAITA